MRVAIVIWGIDGTAIVLDDPNASEDDLYVMHSTMFAIAGVLPAGNTVAILRGPDLTEIWDSLSTSVKYAPQNKGIQA